VDSNVSHIDLLAAGYGCNPGADSYASKSLILVAVAQSSLPNSRAIAHITAARPRSNHQSGALRSDSPSPACLPDPCLPIMDSKMF
jgi:hypothetical protein